MEYASTAGPYNAAPVLNITHLSNLLFLPLKFTRIPNYLDAPPQYVSSKALPLLSLAHYNTLYA